MLEEEVLVAPALEARVKVVAMGRERVAAHAVEVARVFFETVVRREVHAAAEPEHRRLAGFRRDEQAHVHVHGRAVGVARVQHERHARRLEPASCQLRARSAEVTTTATAPLETRQQSSRCRGSAMNREF